MGVALRKQNIKNGRQSLYLDIYHDKKRWTEFLDIKLEKLNSSDARYRNKEKLKIAESIKRGLDKSNRIYPLQGQEPFTLVPELSCSMVNSPSISCILFFIFSKPFP